MQVQIDTFGTYGAFVTMDTTLMSDSLDVETIMSAKNIFSGGSGSVFEFTETNIIYSLERSEEVTARIFNLSGRLKDKPEFISELGHQVMNWDGMIRMVTLKWFIYYSGKRRHHSENYCWSTKSMKHLLSILLLLSTLFSQYDQLFVGTRPLSMGGAFIAVADDANAITWNPANLPGLRRTEFTSTYANLYNMGITQSYIDL